MITFAFMIIDTSIYMSQTQIAEKLGKQQQSVTRTIARRAKKGNPVQFIELGKRKLYNIDTF